MRPLSFWQESEHLQNSGQAFLVRQGSLVFIEHFTIANDRSPYVTDPHSHVSKLYFRDFFNTLQNSAVRCAGYHFITPKREYTPFHSFFSIISCCCTYYSVSWEYKR